MIHVYYMTTDHPHAFGGLVEVCDVMSSSSSLKDIKRKCLDVKAVRVVVYVHDKRGWGHTTSEFQCSEGGSLDARRSGLLRVNGITPSRKAMYESLSVTLKRLRASK